MYTSIFINTYIFIHTYIYTYIYIHMHTYIDIRVYIYTYIYIYIYIYQNEGAERSFTVPGCVAKVGFRGADSCCCCCCCCCLLSSSPPPRPTLILRSWTARSFVCCCSIHREGGGHDVRRLDARVARARPLTLIRNCGVLRTEIKLWICSALWERCVAAVVAMLQPL